MWRVAAVRDGLGRGGRHGSSSSWGDASTTASAASAEPYYGCGHRGDECPLCQQGGVPAGQVVADGVADSDTDRGCDPSVDRPQRRQRGSDDGADDPEWGEGDTLGGLRGVDGAGLL